MNPNSNLERELLGNLNTTSGADAEYQRISNMLLSGLNLTNPQPNQANVRVMQNPNQHLNQTVRPVPIQSNVNITTGGAKPVGIPIVSGQPNTVKVNPSPVRIMTTGNPGSMPVTISTNNSSALPSTFKFTNTGAPVTIPNTGPNVITSNMTAQRPITTTSIPTTITQPQQPTQQQQQANKEATNLKMTNFKLFLEKQAAVFIHDQKSLQQWNETVSQFFNNKGGVSLGKLFEILSVIVGKEKKEAILQQAIREGYVSLPKPPVTTTGTGVPATAAGTVPQSNAGQVGASSATPLVAASGISVGIPYQTHLESLLRQIQTPQRERIIDHLKKLPSESQRNATIMQLVENFNRQKAAAQQGQPNSIKPPSLPSQITDLDKRRILTPVAGKITDTLQSRLLLKEDIVEDLKDVTRIAGIDVDQENAEFLRDNDNIEAFEEDRSPTMIQLNVLKRRMAEIAGRQGLKVITDETIYYLAYSIESLLRDMTQVINKGIPITRMDLHKKSYVDKILQNNKKRAKFIQKVEKEEDNRLKKRRVGDDSKVTESSPRLRESGSSGSPSLRSSSQGTTNILSQINPLSNLTSGSSTSSSVSSSSQAVPSSTQAVPSGVQAAAPVPPQVKSPALSQSVPSSNQAATVPSVPVPATNQTPMSSMGPIGFNLHSMPSNSSSNGTPTNNRSSTILSFDDE